MRLSILLVAVLLLLGACTTATQEPARLVILDGDGAIVTMDADGTNSTTVAESDLGSFFQPVWSLDGNLIASSLGATEPSIHIADVTSGTTYSLATDSFPFYFSWAPTNQLAILRNGENGLRLDTTSVGDEALQDLETLETGQPLYYSWSPDGLALIAHIGGDQLVLNDLSTSASLGVSPGFFQAPRWTEQGIMALEQGESEQRLVLVTPEGESTPIATVTGPATFVANGDGSMVAVQSANQDQNATSAAFQQLPRLPANRLVVVTTDNGEHQAVTTEPVLAYSWSPVNDHLLILDIVPGPQARWSVWTDEGLEEVIRFDPEPSFVAQFVPFFDQYAQSASLWAPDGSAFAFPGSVDGESGIWVHPIEGEPTRISAGTWVSWAP